MKHVIAFLLPILCCACVDGSSTPDSGGVDASAVIPDASVDSGVDWRDGGVQFFEAPISPPQSCDDFCRSIGGLCSSKYYKNGFVSAVFDYSLCERTNYFCGDLPPQQVVCERREPTMPDIGHELVRQLCPCVRDEETSVRDAGPEESGVRILNGPTSGALTSCREVCGTAGLGCGLNQWDFRDPSAALFVYASCSDTAGCDEVPAASKVCIDKQSGLIEQKCACE